VVQIHQLWTKNEYLLKGLFGNVTQSPVIVERIWEKKTATAGFWPCLSGKSLENLLGHSLCAPKL